MRLCFLAATALGLVACGGNVVVDRVGAGGAATTTVTSASTSTSATSTAPPACVRTHDTFHAALAMANGEVIDCALGGPAPVDITVKARVLQSDKNVVVFDACSPAADCPSLIGSLSIEASGFASWIPVGALVQIRFQTDDAFGGCIHRVAVENLPSWDGEMNPVLPWQIPWLGGAEGYEGAIPEGKYAMERVPLECGFEGPGDCGIHDDFELRVHSQGDSKGVRIAMGETALWNMGAQLYQVRNLRSYATGYCDDYWNWAHWLAWTPIPD